MPAAIVLSGGRSTRMGRDKAGLVVNGVTMLDHVLAVLVEAGVSNVVVAGPSGVPDPEPFLGPMAGIVSGWAALDAQRPDPVLVLSCDLPALTPDVVVALIDAGARSPRVAIADDGDQLQPLVAAYRPVALDEIRDAYALGERSVRRCLAGWQITAVRCAPGVLADADSPADLQGFEVGWDDHPNVDVPG